MPVLLFNLRGVPDDEAAEVREVLQQHQIDYYETTSGNWGVSQPAFWLKNTDQLQQAQQAIDAYQQQRLQNARAEYQRLREAGQAPTLLGNFLKDPLRFVLFIAIVAIIIYFSLMPFIKLG